MAERFNGVINVDIRDSEPDWVPFQPPKAPDGGPSVVYIVLDDVGFSAMASYGGPVETPNIDRIAADGVRFTQWHTTALCSPTRSCLLIRPAMETMCELLRAGQPPARITERYAKADAKRGRNEPCPCGSGRKWKRCHGAALNASAPADTSARRAERSGRPTGRTAQTGGSTTALPGSVRARS